MKTELANYLNAETEKLKASQKRERRKRGEHRFLCADGVFPRCVTCGCDEDDAFVGGQECSFGQKKLLYSLPSL